MSIQCDLCTLNFSSRANMLRHKSNIHLKEKNFQCEFCDFKCHQKLNLKKHSCYIKKENPINKDEETSQYSVEYGIQKRLERELKGNKVTCPFGRIDIMTEDTIIEIKKWEDHKKGIGQILGYGVYFPKYKKRLHFFGIKPSNEMTKSIKDVCKKLNIEITEE